MGQLLDRRDWLRQATLTIGGMSIASEVINRLPISGKRYSTELRLHANENPYGPSSLARKAMSDAISSSNCYPWEAMAPARDTALAPALAQGCSSLSCLMTSTCASA